MKQPWTAALVTVFVIAALMVLFLRPTTVNSEADALTGATTATGQESSVLPPPAATYEVIGVLDGLKNFVVKYDERMYRGGKPLAESAAQSLKKYGIRTILSITPTDEERELCRKNGFTLIEIPFEKSTGPSPDDVKRYLEAIQKADGPFYTHCHGGSHRSGVLGVAYRVHLQGWSYEKALVEYGRLGGDLLEDHAMLKRIQTAP